MLDKVTEPLQRVTVKLGRGIWGPSEYEPVPDHSDLDNDEFGTLPGTKPSPHFQSHANYQTNVSMGAHYGTTARPQLSRPKETKFWQRVALGLFGTLFLLAIVFTVQGSHKTEPTLVEEHAETEEAHLETNTLESESTTEKMLDADAAATKAEKIGSKSAEQIMKLAKEEALKWQAARSKDVAKWEDFGKAQAAQGEKRGQSDTAVGEKLGQSDTAAGEKLGQSETAAGEKRGQSDTAAGEKYSQAETAAGEKIGNAEASSWEKFGNAEASSWENMGKAQAAAGEAKSGDASSTQPDSASQKTESSA